MNVLLPSDGRDITGRLQVCSSPLLKMASYKSISSGNFEEKCVQFRPSQNRKGGGYAKSRWYLQAFGFAKYPIQFYGCLA